jgi:kumamolisin
MDEEPITVGVVLNLSDPEGAKALEEEHSDPTSPDYHRTITVSEFTSRFGPSWEAWNTVRAYLEQNGLTLSHTTIDRRTMRVTGTRAQVQKAFQVIVDNYQLGDRTFHAVASDPVVPAAIAPLIAAVSGLSNLARPQPALNPSPQFPASLATAYNGTLTPAGATNTGGLPPGLDGRVVTIGMIEFSGFSLYHVSVWLYNAGLPANLINRIKVYSAVPPAGCFGSPGCPETEALLDIAAVLGTAPGATIEVFEVPPDGDLVLAISEALGELYSLPPAVLSMSFISCENDISQADAATIDSLAAGSLLFGVSLFAGTGDTGAACNDGVVNLVSTIPVPADSPHIIAVGGTTLNVDSNNSYDSESWWSTPKNGSGGFGTSQYFPEPGYQAKVHPGLAGRSVPDVSMYAFPGIAVCELACGTFGGTSLATPLWAATWALLEQARWDAGEPSTSEGPAELYRLATALHAASTMTGVGNDFRHVGLGSPDITKLIAIAVPPQIGSFSPTDGSFAGGTKVTIYGVGFVGVKDVTFGGYAGTNLKIESDTKLTVDTPFANDNAAVEVKVVTPGGTATSFGQFDYDPEVDFVSPAFGPITGGTTVTVSGVALSDNLTFEFGGSAYKATKVSCATTHTSCTMLSPAHAAGIVNVRAVAPWGFTSPVLPIDDQFTY